MEENCCYRAHVTTEETDDFSCISFPDSFDAKNLSICNENHNKLTFLSRVLSTLTAPLWINCGLFNIGMNLYGFFTLEFNHMLLFGELWHANARSLISREDDS